VIVAIRWIRHQDIKRRVRMNGTVLLLGGPHAIAIFLSVVDKRESELVEVLFHGTVAKVGVINP
jgi:hypothetical protein